MSKHYSVTTLKKNNKKNAIRYIYNQRKSTPHKVAEYLELSRPTVANILKELVEEDTIYQEGFANSTGGRKANIFSFNMSKKIAIGVEIRHDRYEVTAINLSAQMLKFETFYIPFRNEPVYFDTLSSSINAFINALNVSSDKILGVGIGLQALISSDGKTIIYGKLLDCTGLSISEFTSRIPYPCTFNHDAESLANSELWFDSSLSNAIFFNIRDNVSGTVIINRDFFRGGELKSGVFEHMTLIPDGKQCYCGKKGCVNAYCSFSALLHPEEDIDSFFSALRTDDKEIKERWEEYLTHLASTIDNLHMIITSDVILGGKISNYLTQKDIDTLHRKVHKRSAFPSEERYIKTSKTTSLPLCVGAAIPLVKKYLKLLF